MSSQDDDRLEQLLEALLQGDSQGSRRAMEDLHAAGGGIDPTVLEKAISTSALLLAVGQPDQACAMLEALARRAPDQPALLNNLAYAHLVGGRLAAALALWERAAVLAPNDGLIRANLVHARQRRSSN